MRLKSLKYVSCLALLTTCLLSGFIVNAETSDEPEKPSPLDTFIYPSDAPKVAKLLHKYRKLGSLTKLKKTPEQYAKNIMSWQMEHGGFGLHDATFYEKAWDSHQKRSNWVSKGRELGNFDDGATVSEVRFLADVFTQTSDTNLKLLIKSSVEHCLQFIFNSQYNNGGWPQVYPKRYRRTYSNHVTLNDDAMIRTMVLLSDILADLPPFDTGLVNDDFKREIYPRLTAAVAYLLNVQIKNNNKLTIWSSQYDFITNEPASARSFELASKSGRESVGVLAYLMNWPYQDEKVVAAIASGIAWFDANKVKNVVLNKGEFSEKSGAELWYRFYELDSNKPFFAGRDGIKKYNLALVEEERRKGYSWGGKYASKILKAAPFYFDELKSK